MEYSLWKELNDGRYWRVKIDKNPSRLTQHVLKYGFDDTWYYCENNMCNEKVVDSLDWITLVGVCSFKRYEYKYIGDLTLFNLDEIHVK